MISNITYKNRKIAMIIRSGYLKKRGINFFTESKLNQQVAFMRHPKNHYIQPHMHKKTKRIIYGTTEVLIILDGKMKIDFYNKKKKFICSRLAKKNDIIILLSFGHGFKMLKNCKFIEVKQGPYHIKEDKNKF